MRSHSGAATQRAGLEKRAERGSDSDLVPPRLLVESVGTQTEALDRRCWGFSSQNAPIAKAL